MDHDDDMQTDGAAGGNIQWGNRIRRERELRGWSVGEAVSRLLKIVNRESRREAPDPGSLARMWKRWEGGGGIRGDYQRWLADLFESVPGALFPPAKGKERVPGGDVTELLQQLQASRVDAASLQGIALAVDSLCSEYAYAPAEQLLLEGRAWLARLVGLLREPMTLSQRREVQVQGGWLALLVACVQYDSGDAVGAELTRRHALSLGMEADHAGIQGWALEIAAWVALTTGNLPGVLTAVQHGLAVAGRSGVSVQLAAQEAKAWARMGDGREALAALDRGRRQLEGLEYPTNVANHFVVDGGKYDFYAMDVRRLSGDDAAAEHLAQEVLAAGRAWDGSEATVMRCSEARVTLGIVAARRGDIEAAVHWGLEALSPERRSLPHLLMVARELTSEILAVARNAHVVHDYVERLREVQGRS